VAASPELLRLAARGRRGHPPANLLFGAVQYLLLGGSDHELRAFYASVGGTRPAEEAFPAFSDFCAEHGEVIGELVASRGVQTNEVGRCGALLPGFGLAAGAFGGAPLALIEVGGSLGLHQNFDRYAYAYSGGLGLGPESPATVRTEIRGPGPPQVPARMPAVASRVGVDLAPGDVTDEDTVRWAQALIWPDQTERQDLFRAAVRLAREDPPRLVAGDGRDRVAELVAEAPGDAVPCVFHSHAVYQMSSSWRREFTAGIDGLGSGRDLARVSLEWLGKDPGPRLELALYRKGGKETRYVARVHHHGAWMEFV
jgi:hypothetical protein